MAMNEFPWLTFLIFLPLVGATALFVVKETSVRLTALGVTLADLLISLPLWWLFDSSSSHMQFGEQALWITAPPIHYRLGLDGTIGRRLDLALQSSAERVLPLPAQ